MPRPRYHSPKPQEASADESFVDRCRGTINILELLAISLGITRWEENSPVLPRSSRLLTHSQDVQNFYSEMKLI